MRAKRPVRVPPTEREALGLRPHRLAKRCINRGGGVGGQNVVLGIVHQLADLGHSLSQSVRGFAPERAGTGLTLLTEGRPDHRRYALVIYIIALTPAITKDKKLHSEV